MCIFFWWRRVFPENNADQDFLHFRNISDRTVLIHVDFHWYGVKTNAFALLWIPPASFRCLRDIANTIKRRPAIYRVHSISIFLKNDSCKCTSVFAIPWNIVFLNNNHWHFSRAPNRWESVNAQNKTQVLDISDFFPPKITRVAGVSLASFGCELITTCCYFFSPRFEIWAPKLMFSASMGHQRCWFSVQDWRTKCKKNPLYKTWSYLIFFVVVYLFKLTRCSSAMKLRGFFLHKLCAKYEICFLLDCKLLHDFWDLGVNLKSYTCWI